MSKAEKATFDSIETSRLADTPARKVVPLGRSLSSSNIESPNVADRLTTPALLDQHRSISASAADVVSSNSNSSDNNNNLNIKEENM